MSALPEHALRRLLADAEPLLERSAQEAERGPGRVGKYEIVRRIGRGGMGVVYEARDVELERRVALKLLDPAAAADASLRERFLREARAAARLSHPNIAAVYDAGEGWIAMRLVDGGPLHDSARATAAAPADLRTRVRWIRDAALAVEHAHEAGIVHRDLKPHNLLLEGERVFVTDFGLAKEIAVDSSLSLSGHVLGSPSYMAPEQAEGRVHAIDARTDVFGLGATLYHLLAGRPPFVEADVVRLMRRIVEEDAPALRRIAADVPRDLETIVHKCLEKEPGRRYASARALADDLDRWLRGEPVLARRPSLAYRAGKLARRHRALVTLSAASLLALAILGVTAWSARVGRAASERALALADDVYHAIFDHGVHVRSGQPEQARARLDEGIAACESFLAEHDVAQGRWRLGRLLRLRGRSAEAKSALDRALELSPGLPEARLERGLLLASELAAARAQLAAGASRDDDALPLELSSLRDLALADLEAAQRGRVRLAEVDALHATAELARLRGDRERAKRAFLELERLDPMSVDAIAGLSQLELEAGDGDAAWHRAMTLVDVAQGLGPAYVARRAGAIATDAERAVRQHEVAAASRTVAGGDRSAEALALLASARLRIDDVDGALADFTRALAVDQSDAFAWGNRALAHARRAAQLGAAGSSGAALAAWDAAIDDVTRALTIEPKLAGAWNNRAVSRAEKERLLVQLGRADDAATERAAAGADLDRALELNPRFALARINRVGHRRRVAEEAARRRDWPAAEAAAREARADASEALRLRPEDPSAWLERALTSDLEADLLAARGELAAASHARSLARADHEIAVGLAPDDAQVLAMRGLHRSKARDAAGAREDLEAALRGPLDRELAARLRAELEALHR